MVATVANDTGLNHKNPFYRIASCSYIVYIVNICMHLAIIIIIKQASAWLKLIAEQSQFKAIASNVYSYTSNCGEVCGCLVANYIHIIMGKVRVNAYDVHQKHYKQLVN